MPMKMHYIIPFMMYRSDPVVLNRARVRVRGMHCATEVSIRHVSVTSGLTSAALMTRSAFYSPLHQV